MDNKKMYIRKSDGAMVRGNSLEAHEEYTLCPCELENALMTIGDGKVEEMVEKVKKTVKKAVKKTTTRRKTTKKK